MITTHVPLPLAAKIDEMAARLQRSRGWIMKQALQAWIEAEGGRAHGFSEAQARFGHEPGVSAAAAVAALKSLRANTNLGDISWQELRDTGRK